MSSKVTINQSKGVRVVGLLAIIAGIVLILAGAVTAWQVSSQLRAEKITVSEDSSYLAGKRVQDPLTAYAQAEVINKHALEMADGKTYAELGQDDPVRATVMNASFLRASLFTSVVAFGLAALVVGLGIFLILLGWALRRLAGGPAIVVETFDGGPAPRHGGAPKEGDLEALTGSTPVVPTRRTARAAAAAAERERGDESPSGATSREDTSGESREDTSDEGTAEGELETTPDGVVLPPGVHAEAGVPSSSASPSGAASGDANGAPGGSLGAAPVSEQLRRRSLAERRAAAERDASSRSAAAGAWAASRTGATPVVPPAASASSGPVPVPSGSGGPDGAPSSGGQTAAVPVPPSAQPDSVPVPPQAASSAAGDDVPLPQSPAAAEAAPADDAVGGAEPAEGPTDASSDESSADDVDKRD